MMARRQFYRRPLPKACIDLVSDEGGQLFKEAMNAGTTKCFLKLAAQFTTQDEPAYCGLTSLVIALNVLEIDPVRVWKGSWRWYTEEMLDCCVSLETIKDHGITMKQFVFLARCNHLDVERFDANDFKSVDQLRVLVKEKMQRDDQILVASYLRSTLGQSGTGHFSPIGGYHEGRDLVLVMDTARFKYPPHWVPLTTMMAAMQTVDPDTGETRGPVILSRSKKYMSTLLFRPSCSFVINTGHETLPPQLWDFNDKWSRWLDLDDDSALSDPVTMFRQFAETAIESLAGISLLCIIMQGKLMSKCNRLCCTMTCALPSKQKEDVKSIFKNLMKELESLEIYERMRQLVSSFDEAHLAKIMDFVTCNEADSSAASTDCSPSQVCMSNPKWPEFCEEADEEFLVSLKISAESILTVIFLCWPINTDESEGSCKRKWINKFVQDDLKPWSKEIIRREVSSLQVKFVEVLNYHIKDASKRFHPLRF